MLRPLEGTAKIDWSLYGAGGVWETVEYTLFFNDDYSDITGQMLHFYLDSQLWKFSVKHNRDVTLKHLYS